MRTLLLFVGLLLAGPVLPLFAQELDYPPGVFNGDVVDTSTVTGVDKTGATDSSAGIQTAINMLCANLPTDKPRQRTLYFPTGTYSISKPIDAVASIDATGTLTSGSATITLASTTNIAVGEWVTGTNIPTNTTVAAVKSSTQITIGNAATGSGATALHFAINLYRLHIAGQSESGTIIRASQSFSGAMIKTEGDNGQQSGGVPLNPAGNTFDNSISDLTVDANGFSVSGIDFLSNNTGNVRNVTVKGGGTANTGILVSRSYPGPCILEDVVVNNFATGIAVGQAEYCVTMENITLSNQSSVGISSSGNSVFIRKLTSTNTNAVHAISNGTNGLLVVLDSSATYSSGTTTANAIDNATSGSQCGGAFVRNFTQTGYALAVSNPNTGGANTTGSATQLTNKEFSTHPVLTPGLPNSATTSLNLPIQETPVVTDNNFANWYSVASYGAVPNTGTDQSAAIQSALDATATLTTPATVYFPPGKYTVNHTLTVHGNVQRLLGFGTYLMPSGSASGVFGSGNATNLQPVIQVGGTSDITGSLEIDNLGVYPTSTQGATYYIGLQQSTTKAVTLRSLQIASGNAAEVAYQSTSTGTLFLDDVEGANWLFTTPGQSIFARQFDVEGDTTGVGTSYAAKITNTGCQLWVLGLKTEDDGTLVESTAGASTEIDGAFCYPVHNHAMFTDNLFDVQNSDFSACYDTFGGSSVIDYPNQVGQTESGTSATVHCYSSTSTPKAYLRQESGAYSMAPLVVASTGIAIPGVDIGTVGTTGTATQSSGTYTISGAGAGVGGTADALHFCSQPLSGDYSVTAEVTSLPYVTSSEQAGVMIRDDMTAGSDMVMCSLNKTSTSVRAFFIIRAAEGGSAVQAISGSLTVPYWVRLSKHGNNFNAYVSPDAATWTQVGLTHTFSMTSSAPNVGLGVTSGSTTTLLTPTFTNYTLAPPTN
jgi:regulation of enolase protein 1 (concanavalin A-like superfamily)